MLKINQRYAVVIIDDCGILGIEFSTILCGSQFV